MAVFVWIVLLALITILFIFAFGQMIVMIDECYLKRYGHEFGAQPVMDKNTQIGE